MNTRQKNVSFWGEKHQALGALILAFVFALQGCGSPTTAEAILENVTVDSNTTVILNQTELAESFTARNQAIELEGGTANTANAQLTLSRANQTFTLTLRGEVDSPTVSGNVLQATAVTLKGNFAFVSYNTRGNPYTGALDVIDIRSPNNPQLRSRTIFRNKDINHVYYGSGKIILAEALDSGTEGFNSQISIYPLQSNRPDFDNGSSELLRSFAANSVYTKSSKFFATSGSTGSLYYLDQNLNVLSETSVADARWVHGKGNKVAVLSGGENPKLQVFTIGSSSLTQTADITVAGATEAEAKSVVAMSSRYGFIAGNQQGVLIYKLSDGSLAQRIEIPTVTDPEVEVSTNALSIYKDLLFAAQGEAGVYVYKNDKQLTSIQNNSQVELEEVGKLVLGTGISANDVVYRKDYLIVAAGLGGVKLITVSNSKAKGDEDDEDEDDDDD